MYKEIETAHLFDLEHTIAAELFKGCLLYTSDAADE